MGGRGSSFQTSNNVFTERKFPELTGSEKQIKWANDIRDSALDITEANIESNRNYLKRFKNDFDAKVKLDLYESARRAYLEKLRSVTSAKEIIDNRHLYDVRMIVGTVNDEARDMANQRANGWQYDKKKKRMVKK